MMSYVAQFSY